MDLVGAAALLSLLFGFVIVSRCFLLLRNKWVGIDSFYHLLVARDIRRTKKLPSTIEQFVFKENYDYPPLFHFFLSLFDEKHHRKLQYTTPIFDIITGLVIFCGSFFIFGESVAIIALALFATTPIALDNACVLSPRGFANALFVTSLFSLAYFLATDNVLFYVVALIFTALVFLSHRLTTQALWAVLVCLSVAESSVIPISILVFALLLAVVVSRGFYVKSLIGHLNYVKRMASSLFDSNKRGQLHCKLPHPLLFLFNMPILILLPVVILSGTLLKNGITYSFSIWFLSIFVLSVVWIFGEGYRHIYLLIVPYSIILSYYFINSLNLMILYFVVALSIVAIVVKLYRAEHDVNLHMVVNDDFICCCNFIKEGKKKNDIIFCLPMSYGYSAAYFTDGLILQGSGGEGAGYEFNLSLTQRVESEGLSAIVDDYKPTWGLVVGDIKSPSEGSKVYGRGNISVLKFIENNG
jgi:hypothetical protein